MTHQMVTQTVETENGEPSKSTVQSNEAAVAANSYFCVGGCRFVMCKLSLLFVVGCVGCSCEETETLGRENHIS